MAQDKKDPIFADGFSFKRRDDAPDFVVGRLSMKVEDAIEFMTQHEKRGWVNIDIKYSKSGKAYCELDQYEPKIYKDQEERDADEAPKSRKPNTETPGDDDSDDLPF